MAVRGRRENPIDREGNPWRAFVDDLQKLRGTATLADIGAKVGYSTSHLAHRLNPGNVDMSEQFVRAYAEACGANPDEWVQRRREALEGLKAMGASTVPRPAFSPEGTADTLGPFPIGPRPSRHRIAVVAFAAVSGLVVLTGTVVKALLDGADGPPGVSSGVALSTSPSLPPGPAPSDTPGDAPSTPLSASSSASPPSSPGASSDASSNVVPLPAHDCRDDWAKTSVEFVLVMPCIRRDSRGIAISAKIKSTKREGPAEEVTLWIWLMKHDRRLVERRQSHLTRDEKSLRRCRIRLANGGRVATCGPFMVPPPADEGRYTTSSSVRNQDAPYPPGWNDSVFTGTQGGLITWRPT